MKHTLFFVSLLALASVECSPAGSTPPGGDHSNGAENSVAKTMGKVDESKCKGDKMEWSKEKTPWQNSRLADNFVLYQNIWKSDQVLGTGKSEITCKSFKNGNLAWQTTFDLPSAPENAKQVKAYTNVAWVKPSLTGGQKTQSIQVKNAKVFNTAWDWQLTGDSKDLVADVSYDIFLSKDPTCQKQECASREIMVWLSAIGGARPAGARAQANGGTLKLGGKYEFQVWQGTSQVPVVSVFPAQDNQKFTSFSADMKELLKNLGPFGVSQDEYLVSVGAGIEIFTGKGSLSTTKYTLDLY